MKAVEHMTYKELLEAQQRYKKTLSNKYVNSIIVSKIVTKCGECFTIVDLCILFRSVLQKLPDKGKKLVETNSKIEEKLLEYQTETDGLSQMLSGMTLSSKPNVNQMEWTGKIGSTNSLTQAKSENQQPSPHDESRDIVDILLTTNQMSKIIIDER